MKREIFALACVLVKNAFTSKMSYETLISSISQEYENVYYFESGDDCDLMDIIELIGSLWYNIEHASIPDVFDRHKKPFV